MLFCVLKAKKHCHTSKNAYLCDMGKKTVLLDICEIGNPTSGFGQIAKNYYRLYQSIEDKDLSFHFLLPEGFKVESDAKVQMTNIRNKYHKHFSKGLPEVDLWHSTNQQQIKRKRGECKKFVLTIHDLNFLTEKNWIRQLKHRFFLQRAINQADAVTCISQFVAHQVEQLFNMRGKSVRVIYNGVEDISEQPEEKPSFAKGRPFFFAIGQIRAKKNFHLLVDMMRQFPDYDLYVCGDDHFDYAQTVREHINQLPTHNAYLCGKIQAEEKVWLYRHCEAFLFASQGEGFGLPAIEAMQFGKPVFIANATCLPEICGDCAYVWPSLNPDEMGDFVKSTLRCFNDSPERTEQIKEHATLFSYDRHIQSYLQLYKELLCE
jgi:glycosyltransferase involved in cell wall biosynthesis